VSTGELIALACALSWSVAVIFFRKAGDDVHPVALNLFKNTLALVLMVPTLFLVEGVLFYPTGSWDLAILGVSGILGIGIADALVLKSLALVGASRWAIVECLYSPFVIGLALLFLGEALGAREILGAVLVLSAILCVTGLRGARRRDGRAILHGTLLGAAGLLTMAVGILLVKPLFARVSLLWVIEVRLIAGVLGSILALLLVPGWKRALATLRPGKSTVMIVVGSLFSTYIAMILWVAGFKYNDASVAAVLNQTATIFTVVLAAIFLREALTWRKVAGTVLALSGVFLMTTRDVAVGAEPPTSGEKGETMASGDPAKEKQGEVATLGGGCFWCIEAVFQQTGGVLAVRSGYMGGTIADPTYKQVCTGTTGHAEVVEVRFDPEKVSYRKILEVFFRSHDPTTLNRQGGDVGTQYRSAIFFHGDEQKRVAEEVKKELSEKKAFSTPIVTEIVPATNFFVAEDYHQDYYELNKRAPYCQAVIAPKLRKLGLEE